MPLFDTDGKNLVNSTQSLWRILQNATEDPQAGPIIIVLDALDECDESEFADLMQKVESQFRNNYSSSSQSKLKYLLTCRPYEQITSQFHGLLRQFPNIRIPGEEESESISQEVNRVIIHRVKQLSEKNKFSAKISSFIKKKLQETTHRTYLWVYLVFSYLEENVAIKKTQKEIELIITTHPKNVNEAYEKILNKSENEHMVRRVLSIVLAATRPLTLSEMNIATSINDTTQDDTTNTFDDLDLEDESDFKSRLRSLCGLFISIYHGKIYFLHQTAREYLLADLASPTVPSGLRWHRSITTRQAHSILAELCVLYLNLFNSGVSSTIKGEETTGSFTDNNAFLNYSAENWGTHFSKADFVDGAAILPVTLRICDTSLKSYSAWFTIYQAPVPQCPVGNLTDLIIASHYGHSAVIKLLVEKGADIEAKDDKYGWAPLLWAAEHGDEASIKLLIGKGANIEAKDNRYGRTPLSWAVGSGNEAIVKLLVEQGADIEAMDTEYGQTPLSLAAKYGQEAIAKMLVENGANIEAEDNNSRTPLLWAALHNQEAIVKLLVEKGANIEAKDNQFGWTPLSLAAEHGNEFIVQLLVEKGANIKSEAEFSQVVSTLLQWET